jgi:plastin-1
VAVPDQIDERAMNFPKAGKALNPWEVKENNNLAIGAAKSIGCSIVNIHASDISNCVRDHREYLMLGMIWQIVKMQLLSSVNLKAVPELVRISRAVVFRT